MDRRIAVYGKGGIGKSTISSNLTAALGSKGVRVLQIGCDPKHDSTRLLIGGRSQRTVLDYLKNGTASERRLEDVVLPGFNGCLCVEAGGPEPGVGCAGRGIISAFELLRSLGADSLPADMTIYDVLGDVVCGGFAVPLRNDYADTVYIVTSGEFMSIYAANNILRGTANYNPDRIGGLIFNSRGDPEERNRISRFSEAVGIPIVAEFERSNLFMTAEESGMTVVEMFPGSSVADGFMRLADNVSEGRRYRAESLSEEDLEGIVLKRRLTRDAGAPAPPAQTVAPERRAAAYTSRNVDRGEPLHGCAFSGAASVTDSVTGLTTVMHSPASCAGYAFQMSSGSVIRSWNGRTPGVTGFSDPDVHCTGMSENAAVFGGTRELRSLMESQMASGKRDFAIISSCPSGIIGDDVGSVISSLKAGHPDLRVAFMEEDGNAAGDFMQGVIDAGIGLARTFCSRGERTDGVNLVGVKCISSNCTGDIGIVSRLLSGIGVGVNCTFPGVTDIRSIERIADGRMNLLMNPDRFSAELARFLKDEYGIDRFANTVRPGITGTSAWLSEVAGMFGREEEAARLMEGLDAEYRGMLSGLAGIMEGRTYCIMAMGRDIDWIIETADRLGMVRKRTYVIDRPDYSNDLDVSGTYGDVEMRSMEDAEGILAEVDGIMPDMLIAPAPVRVDPRIRQSYITTIPDPGPFSGRRMAEGWARSVLSPDREGWRDDALRL